MNVREWALPVYTILMQLAVGALLTFWVIRQVSLTRHKQSEVNQILSYPLLVIVFTVFVAMIGSHFHLSKPYLSFLSVLNFRSSWLSREVAFTALFFLFVCWLFWLHHKQNANTAFVGLLGWVTILIGLVTVYSMSKIYMVPSQIAWNTPLTVISYYKSAVLLGVFATGSLLTLGLKFARVRQPGPYPVRVSVIRSAFLWLPVVAIAAMLVSIGLELIELQTLGSGDASALASLELWLGIYRPLYSIHLGLMLGGVGLFVFTTWLLYNNKNLTNEMVTPTYLACLLIIISEILGRFLFYATHVRTGI